MVSKLGSYSLAWVSEGGATNEDVDIPHRKRGKQKVCSTDAAGHILCQREQPKPCATLGQSHPELYTYHDEKTSQVVIKLYSKDPCETTACKFQLQGQHHNDSFGSNKYKHILHFWAI